MLNHAKGRRLDLGAAGGGQRRPRRASKVLRWRSGVRRSGPVPYKAPGGRKGRGRQDGRTAYFARGGRAEVQPSISVAEPAGGNRNILDFGAARSCRHGVPPRCSGRAPGRVGATVAPGATRRAQTARASARADSSLPELRSRASRRGSSRRGSRRRPAPTRRRTRGRARRTAGWEAAPALGLRVSTAGESSTLGRPEAGGRGHTEPPSDPGGAPGGIGAD